jgi:hypothetical protein
MPTLNLGLPYIAAGQAQKHVTHNDALDLADALINLTVLSRVVTSPPATPVNGARYLLPATPTGAFAGQGGNIAVYQNAGWRYITPKIGWRTYIIDEQIIVAFNGTVWNALQSASISPLARLENMIGYGIGTTFDTANPLSAKLNSALFTAQPTSGGGTGDLRLTLNKSTALNTVSQLYQTNFSGRAETGLTGDDRYHIKVSPDGSTWKEAINIDPVSGQVGLTQGVAALGIGTVNPSSGLSVVTNALPLNAQTVANGGTGDLRVTLNKSTISNTASQLYQTNLSGRAETGLTGDDKYRIKVSPDGTLWKDALNIDPTTAQVTLSQGIVALGIGTTNPASGLSVVSNNVPISAQPTGSGGTGDLRLTLNKSLATNTVSQLYQTAFSGRAETGLTGDDKYRVKVSPDGTVWKDALTVDSTSAQVTLTQGVAALGIGVATPASGLSVVSNAIPFNAQPTTNGGTGDLRLTLNKSAISNTASQIFQNNLSGRAEAGLTGDDRYRIKVSTDGTIWKDAVNIDPVSGQVGLTQGVAALGIGVATPASGLSVVTNNLPIIAQTVSGGGTGDLRIRYNKVAITNILSQIYQTNFSGRVEAGLIGDDKYRVKVSADGTTWRDSIICDPATGQASFPSGIANNYGGLRNKLLNANFDIWQRGSSFVVANNASQYSADRWIVGNGASGISVTFAKLVAPSGFKGQFALNASGTGCAIGANIDFSQKMEAQVLFDMEGLGATLSFDVNATTSAGTLTGTVLLNGNTAVDNGTYSTALYSTTFTVPVGVSRVSVPIPVANSFGLKVGAQVTIRFQQTVAIGNPNISIGAVQLEKGIIVNPFEFRPNSMEIALCQRYFWQRAATATGDYASPVTQGTDGIRALQIPFPVKMRITPACSVTAATSGAFLATYPLTEIASGDFARVRADVTTATASSWVTSFSANAEL